jgi:microcompartment protein CcmK/EutM
MFIARIHGAVVTAAKHATMQSCRFLLAQRMEADGQSSGEPIVVADWLGAGAGARVIVSTDGDLAREKLGNTTPVRMVVVGIIDHLHVPSASGGSAQ